MAFLKWWWQRTRKFLVFIGKLQSLLLLTLFYYLILGPVALVYKAFSWFFRLRGVPSASSAERATSYWIKRNRAQETVVTLLRQF